MSSVLRGGVLDGWDCGDYGGPGVVARCEWAKGRRAIYTQGKRTTESEGAVAVLTETGTGYELAQVIEGGRWTDTHERATEGFLKVRVTAVDESIGGERESVVWVRNERN